MPRRPRTPRGSLAFYCPGAVDVEGMATGQTGTDSNPIGGTVAVEQDLRYAGSVGYGSGTKGGFIRPSRGPAPADPAPAL